jgi:hypothetical protein
MEPTASAAEQERAALEATAEAEAAAWAQQRKRARRLRQGARLVGLFGSPSVAQVDSVLDPEGASSQPVAMPARAQSHRHMVVAAEDDRVPAADADASTDAIASIRMTPHTRETVELVLGTHWDAAHEIVHSTVRDGRRKIDAAAGRRAKATEERLQQLELEVQSKLKLQAMTKVLQDLPVEDILADMEAHVKEVTAVVRKDHQDWLLSHLDFVDEFAKFHSGRLHDLLTRVGDEHEARVSLREERIQHKKETRIDMVTQMVTDQVREELRRDMEMRICKSSVHSYKVVHFFGAPCTFLTVLLAGYRDTEDCHGEADSAVAARAGRRTQQARISGDDDRSADRVGKGTGGDRTACV